MAKDMSEQLEDWEIFLQNPMWKELVDVLQTQYETRVDNIVLRNLATMDEALGVEFMKGEASFAKLIINLPQTIIEELKTSIKMKQKESEENASQT